MASGMWASPERFVRDLLGWRRVLGFGWAAAAHSDHRIEEVSSRAKAPFLELFIVGLTP